MLIFCLLSLLFDRKGNKIPSKEKRGEKKETEPKTAAGKEEEDEIKGNFVTRVAVLFLHR